MPFQLKIIKNIFKKGDDENSMDEQLFLMQMPKPFPELSFNKKIKNEININS